jgi:hypothetical protein
VGVAHRVQKYKVVGGLIDPERIANAHLRVHALEGRGRRGAGAGTRRGPIR